MKNKINNLLVKHLMKSLKYRNIIDKNNYFLSEMFY